MHKRCLISFSVAMVLIGCGLAMAYPTIGTEWEAKYPTSTLPSRMASMAGSDCYVCHHPSIGTIGNCYRTDLSELLGQGYSIADAIEALDTVDSDGDGVANGEEILTPHADMPGEIGYNMGLVGEFGTDPCAADPGEIVTGVWETPPSAPASGDCDGDGTFDLSRDLPCFINVLLEINTDPGAIDRSDLNGDGDTNGLDVQNFVTCVIAGC